MFGSTAGTAIPDWSYSTGVVIDGARNKVDRLLVDATGDVVVGLSRTAAGAAEASKIVKVSDQGTPVEAAGWATNLSYQWRLLVSGENDVVLRRLCWARSGTDGFGGETP
jgi:hypothetical protein